MQRSDPGQEFNSAYYLAVNNARDEVFHRLIPLLIEEKRLVSAIDVGCGIGHYSSYLTSLGLHVTGLDGRSENISSAQTSNPETRFISASIEDLADVEIGSYDLVFCAGLLYHLENPFKAIRNMRALCKSVCVVESRVHWSDFPLALFVRDGDGPTQALAHYAMILTRRCLINMLYASGFDHVYSFAVSSSHPELSGSGLKRPRRHFFVASLEPLSLSDLKHEVRHVDDDMEAMAPYTNSRQRFLKSVKESICWLVQGAGAK